MSASYDLTGLRRGNSFRRTFRFKDGAGDPVDLTGSVLVFVAEAGTVRIRKSTEDGSLAMPDPTDGEITLSLSPAETRLFPVGRLRARSLHQGAVSGSWEATELAPHAREASAGQHGDHQSDSLRRGTPL